MESAGLLSVAPYLEAIPPEIVPALSPLIERLASLLGPLPAAAAGKTSFALFDAGPGQLGAPHIAQLAALIALTRRADGAGARFAWGILQEPQSALSQTWSGSSPFTSLSVLKTGSHQAIDSLAPVHSPSAPA
ncbi:MAG TPA: hypothetical protein VGG03_20865 [Thermoanaerobaculia bacterium]|jgi:hypothetical protein